MRRRILLFAFITLCAYSIYPNLFQHSITIINAQNVTHTVQYGENLSTIAHHYKVKVTQIIRLNNLSNPNILRVGQQLAIPSGSSIYPTVRAYSPSPQKLEKTVPDTPIQKWTAPVSNSGGSSSANCGTNLYTVRPGDTLSGLALIYHSTAAQLRQCNNLSSDLIWVGQLLHVPGPRVIPTAPPDRRPVGEQQ